MKIRWFLLLGCVISMPLLAQQDAPHRIAYVNVPWILNNSPQVKAVENQLKETFIKRENDLIERQQHLDRLRDRVKNASATLTQDEARQLEREIVSGERRLKIAEEEFQEDVALRKSEEINKLRRKISEVIQAVAREGGVDMVFETAAVYVSERVDISEAVLARLGTQYELNGGSPASGKGAGK